MPKYRFDMGNSSEGEVGYVAYVEADSPEHAAEKLRVWMSGGVLAEVRDREVGVEIIAYANLDPITADRAELVEE